MKKIKLLSFFTVVVMCFTIFTLSASAEALTSPRSVGEGQGVYMTGFIYDFINDSECVGIQQFEGTRLTVSASLVSIHSGSVNKVNVIVYQQNIFGAYYEVASGSFNSDGGIHTVISGAKITPNRNIKFVAWLEGTNQPTATIGMTAVASTY